MNMNEMLNTLHSQTAYAEIYVANNATAVSVPSGATYTKTAINGATLGAHRNCTPSTVDSNMTITKSGIYLVNCTFSSKLGTTDVIWDTSVFVNNTEAPNLHMRRRFSTSGYTFNVCIAGIISLNETDVIDIRVKHNNASAVSITNEYANISIVRV